MDDLFQLRNRSLVLFHLRHQPRILPFHPCHFPLEQPGLFRTPQSAPLSRLTVAQPPHNAPFSLAQLSVLPTALSHCLCAPLEDRFRRRLHDRVHAGCCRSLACCPCECRRSRLLLYLRRVVGMMAMHHRVVEEQWHGRGLGLCRRERRSRGEHVSRGLGLCISVRG